MSDRRVAFSSAALAALALVACTSAPDPSQDPSDAGSNAETTTAMNDGGLSSADAAPPLACEPERGLLLVTEALADANEPCRDWIGATLGHAVRVLGGGSGSVWSRRTAHGTGLMLTASHVSSRCVADKGAPRDPAGNCPEVFTEPRNGINGARLTEPAGVYASRWTPMFALYNNFIPAALLASRNILPRHEISLYVVDATTYEPWDWDTITATPTDGLVPLYDPNGVTLATPTWREPGIGARVITLGYPSDNGQRDLVAGIGRVLADDEVVEAQRYLREHGDEEGSVEYEPAVEFFYRGVARPGMSGAGIFDEAGRQVGMAVRASQLESGRNYVRGVRMSYVVSSVRAALQRLPSEQRAGVQAYLEIAP